MDKDVLKKAQDVFSESWERLAQTDPEFLEIAAILHRARRCRPAN